MKITVTSGGKELFVRESVMDKDIQTIISSIELTIANSHKSPFTIWFPDNFQVTWCENGEKCFINSAPSFRPMPYRTAVYLCYLLTKSPHTTDWETAVDTMRELFGWDAVDNSFTNNKHVVIINCSSAYKAESEINKLLDDGYTISGNMICTYDSSGFTVRYIQQMIKH